MAKKIPKARLYGRQRQDMCKRRSERRRARAEANANEPLSQEMITGALIGLLGDMFDRLREHIEESSPEYRHLVGGDFRETVQNFSDAGERKSLATLLVRATGDDLQIFGMIAFAAHEGGFFQPSKTEEREGPQTILEKPSGFTIFS